MNFGLSEFFNSLKARVATASAVASTAKMKFLSLLPRTEQSDSGVEASVIIGGYGQKRRFPKPSFKVTHFDLRYNEKMIIKAINGHSQSLYRMKGKTVVQWKGHTVVFDYPVFNFEEFSSWLNSVDRYDDLAMCKNSLCQEILWLEYCMLPYRHRKSRSLIVKMNGKSAVISDEDGVLSIRDLCTLVPLERQVAGDFKVLDKTLGATTFEYISVFFETFSFDALRVENTWWWTIFSSVGLLFCALINKWTYGNYTEVPHPLKLLLAVVSEEVHKRLFFMSLPVAELIPRLIMNFRMPFSWQWFLPWCAFIMHCITYFLPFWIGILFHFCYNYGVIWYFSQPKCDSLESLLGAKPSFRERDSFNEAMDLGLTPVQWKMRYDVECMLRRMVLERNLEWGKIFEADDSILRPRRECELIHHNVMLTELLRVRTLIGAVGLEDVVATVYHQHLLDISKMMQLLRFVVQEQYDHALHALVNFGYAESLLSFLQLDGGPERVIDYFFSMFSKRSEETVFLAHTPLRSFMEKFLPTFVKKSPTYVAIVTLVSCIMSSSLFSSWKIFYEFLPLVDFSKLSMGDMIATAIESGFCIIKSLWDAARTGNFREFFRRPKEYVMRVRVMEALDRKPTSVEENVELIKLIDGLVEDIHMNGDPYLLREVDKLSRKKREFSDSQLKLGATLMISALSNGDDVDSMKFDEMITNLMNVGEHRLISDLYVAKSRSECQKASQKILREAAVILGLLRVGNEVDENRINSVVDELSRCGESRLIVEIESARQKAVVMQGNKALAACVSRWMTMECKTLEEYSALIDEISESFVHLIEHPQLLVKAKDLRDDLVKRRNACYKRTPPLVIFLLGNPGTGKTTAMSQITRMWCQLAGVSYDPAIEGYLYTDQKHPAETISQDGQIMFLNDVTAEHSQDDKSDKTSLGEIFRSIMDSTPLVFPSAQVGRKGMNFWNLKLVFVTTNARSFVFSEDAERLKRRFDEFAIVVDYEICDNGVPVEHKVYSKWDTIKRNANTMVKLYTATCEGKILSFKNSASRNFVHVSWLYTYLYERFKMRPILAERQSKMLANICKCGLLKASHFRDGEFVTIVPNVCEPCEIEAVVRLPSLCPCGLETFHQHNPIFDCGGKFTSGLMEVACYAVFLFVICTHFERIWNNVAATLRHISSTSRDVMMSAREVKTSVMLIMGLGDTVTHVADLAYYRFMRSLKKFAILMTGGLGFYALIKLLLRDSSKLTHKVIVRENTDLSSLKVDSHRFEVNWPRDTAERWGKQQQEMKVVQLSKVGVGNLDLCRKVESARKKVDFYRVADPSKASTGYAFVIGPEVCLMNRHYFYKENTGEFDPKYVDFEGVRGIIDESCVREVFHEGLKTDVLVVKSPKVSMNADMLSFFAESFDSSQSYGVVPGVSERGVVTFGISVVDLPCLEGRVWRMMHEGLEGQCGSPVVVETPRGSFIAGVVSFGSKQHQGGNVLFQRDIVEALESFSTPVVVKTCVSFTLSETLSNIMPLDPKAEIRNVVTPYCEPIGTAPGGTMKFHSSMARTDLYEFASQRWSKEYDFPKRIRTVKDGKFLSAFTNTMSGITAHGVIAPALLSKAVNIFYNYFVENVTGLVGEIKSSPATLEESIFGARDLDMERSNFNSSLGPEDRHWKTRKDLFNLVGDTFVADQNFTEKINGYIQELKKGCMRVMHVSGAFKDEIRSSEKLSDMWVRIFCTIDHPSNIVSRMYLQPLVQILLRFPQFSKCFGKMNSGSSEWNDLYEYLKQGVKWCDMDFKNFDISHLQAVIRAVAEFFYLLALKFYGDEEVALICYCLVMSLCVQIFQFQTDYMLKIKGLPSGHILTLILNSIVNVLLMMCAFEESGHDMNTFFQHVFPAVVGDDNLSGLSAEVCDTFNLAVVQPIYKRYGYTVTDAKKSLVVEPFVSEENAQFLKRGFRHEKALGQVVAPIDLDSIWKMLAFWTKKSSGQGVKTYIDRMVSVIDVAQRELFLHGEDVFNREVSALRSEVEKLGWEAKWYEWSELLEMYRAGDQFMFWA